MRTSRYAACEDIEVAYPSGINGGCGSSTEPRP